MLTGTPTLLQQRDAAQRERRLAIYVETRQRLQALLAEMIPDQKVILFGSLTKPGVFNDYSDVDLALETEPSTMSVWQLTSLLAERLGRSVDVVLLNTCRFKDTILRDGEPWTA